MERPYIVDFKPCVFEKEGKAHTYYRIVFTEQNSDFKVKTMTRALYERLTCDCSNIIGAETSRIFYDEFGRVCEIEF